MKLLLPACALIAFALCVPAPVSGSGLDAFLLAVEHFDPGHEKGIEYFSDEVEFMRQVLRRAREEVPAVAGLHAPVDGSVESKFGPAMYRTLRVKPPAGWAGRRDEAQAMLKDIGESIGQGCRYEEQINNRYGSNRVTSTTRRMHWDIGGECEGDGDRRRCENTETAAWLCSLGVGTVTLKEHEYKGRGRTDLFVTFRPLVDLEYCAKRIAGDPLYSAVFRDLELIPYGGTGVGDGPTLRVVPVEGLSGFGGARVELSVGWGDCPSGCIYRHYWVFEYRVEGERVGEDWPLVGGLLEESGDRLTF